MQATRTQITAPPARATLPSILLRLEGVALFAGAVALYGFFGYSWGMGALLLLAPDLAMVGYLINTRIGGIMYNIAHTTSVPLLIGVLGIVLAQPLLIQLGLIWLAHIGMDRAIGYGLKYADAFKHTHLGRV